jgi:Acetyl-CoA carboxylase beta subunit
MAERVDVSIEQKDAPPESDGKRHPNTCPKCDSHYRDDELESAQFVCAHCNHHFPVPARKRIDQLADPGSFVEEAAELRSEDPLSFFDLRPYAERLAEAELKTGSAMRW